MGYGLALASLLALFFAVGARNLEGFSWDRDEGLFLMSARMMQFGHPLYREVWFDYPPLLFASLMLAFRWFGATVTTGRMVVLAFATLGLLGVSLVTRKVAGVLGALVAPVLLAISPPFWCWSRAVIADLPAASVGTLAIFCILCYIDSNSARRYAWLALSGGFLALSVLIKPTVYLTVIPLVAVVFLHTDSSACHLTWRHRLKDVAGIVASALLVSGVVFSAFDGPAFVSQMTTTWLQTSRSTPLNLGRNVRFVLEHSFGVQYATWAFCGLLSFCAEPSRKRVCILVWFLATLGSLLSFSFLGEHHLIAMLFPLSVFGGIMVDGVVRSLSQPPRTVLRRVNLLLGLSGVVITLVFLPRTLRADKALLMPYESPIIRHSQDAVEFIRQVTAPDDLVVTDDQMIAFRADRKVIPWLSNTSEMRMVAVGDLTSERMIGLVERYQPGAVILWGGDRLCRLPDFVEWIKAHYGVGRAYDSEHRIYLPLAEPRYSQQVNWGRKAMLLGFDLDALAFQPGEVVHLTLYWKALEDMDIDYTVFVHLLDRHANRYGQGDALPMQGSFPTKQWQPGEIIRDEHLIPIAPDAPPGEYVLQVGLYDALYTHQRLSAYAPDGSRWPEDAAQLVRPLLIGLPEDRLFTVPTMAHRLEARLGESIQLLGCDLERAENGRRLVLTLYWQALGRVSGYYKVFTHLLDAEGRIMAQHDGVPGEGVHPTLGWVAGEVIADRHELAMLPQGLTGRSQLAVGMYDPLTGARLPARDIAGRQLAEDRILIEGVRDLSTP